AARYGHFSTNVCRPPSAKRSTARSKSHKYRIPVGFRFHAETTRNSRSLFGAMVLSGHVEHSGSSPTSRELKHEENNDARYGSTAAAPEPYRDRLGPGGSRPHRQLLRQYRRRCQSDGGSQAGDNVHLDTILRLRSADKGQDSGRQLLRECADG